MHILGNIIWLVFGGFFTAIGYIWGGLVMMLTIIGIPFGFQLIKIGVLCLWPFGSTFGINNELPGCLSLLLNLIWLGVAGFWLALTHFIFGVLLSLTIIGLPWGAQHFKLAGFAISPFGRSVRIDS
ncbi:MAG: YccF domain-containing protein [Bacteroidales bacterium]|nr:YccF domain-containing protein [Bacteroidales bacterium]MDT8431969.1 YccF domain-containing protein [Bacteroidales bacterium]